ncbi:hypothetical protein MH117_09690 [Paenibacillus sp. ACRRX]|uniref:hypothetical protein n=1 Tax=Paenibacillus sp. ACRRX TaxID=2918206 RepID=UPI001EF4A35F|nr:hypothetical protein [Paenibacillus sp. ACRRX]MCG7407695.1 hypothetical protein [Paenibacillus sp. ACRRX]
MPLGVPLKQTVVVSPFISNDPDWNEPVYGTPYEAKCRVTNETKLVRNQHGQEVVSSAQLLFNKLPKISTSDKFEFTDENGVTETYAPISIDPKRWLNGKAILTVVSCE